MARSTDRSPARATAELTEAVRTAEADFAPAQAAGARPLAQGRRTATLALAFLALALVGCRPVPAPGTLALTWVLASDGTPGPAAVRLEPDWAGAGRGPVRDAGWTRIPVAAGEVTVVAGADSPGSVAYGQLPSGRYNRVFIAAPVATALDGRGNETPLLSHVEPIARGFDLAPGEDAAIEIELVVRPPSSTGDGRPELFVKDARRVTTPGGPHMPVGPSVRGTTPRGK